MTSALRTSSQVCFRPLARRDLPETHTTTKFLAAHQESLKEQGAESQDTQTGSVQEVYGVQASRLPGMIRCSLNRVLPSLHGVPACKSERFESVRLTLGCGDALTHSSSAAMHCKYQYILKPIWPLYVACRQ